MLNSKENIIESGITIAKQKFNLRSWDVLIVLLILGFAWRAFFIYRDVSWLTNHWLFEDFGYSLKIAKNIALGLGETFDGVVPTNGYQPLYVWLMVPVFWVFKTDLITPIYVAVTLLAVANVATGIFIYSILKRLTGEGSWALLGVSFWMFNLAIAKDGTNGLEAGLSTMMVAATIDYYIKIDTFKLGMSKAVTLGLLLGVSFLARVDAVFLVAAVFILMLWPNPASLKERIAFGAVTGVSFLLVAAPYAIWNLLHFGSPLPTSGLVTTGKSSLFDFSQIGLNQLVGNVKYGLYIVWRVVSGNPSINGWVAPPSTPKQLWAATAIVISVFICLLIFAARVHSSHRHNQKAFCFLVLLALLYLYGYTIHSFVAFERYFLPVALLLTILYVFSIRITFLEANGKATLILPFFSIVIIAYLAFVSKSFIFDKFPKPIDWYDGIPYGWYDGISMLNSIASQGDAVAGMQSGNLGYFYTKGRSINLDGVVNLDAYKARKRKNLDEYIQQQHIKYLADEGVWVFKVSNEIGDVNKRALFMSSLRLVDKSNSYHFNIFKIESVDYHSIRKLENNETWTQRTNNEMLFGNASFANIRGAQLKFISSRCFDLKFLKHDRSGIVKVFKDGILIREIDLFSKIQDSTYKEFFSQDLRPHTYTLEVSDKKNPASSAVEVWLDAVLERQNCEQDVGK